MCINFIVHLLCKTLFCGFTNTQVTKCCTICLTFVTCSAISLDDGMPYFIVQICLILFIAYRINNNMCAPNSNYK